MIYLLFTIVGFGLGFAYCNMTYIRYKKTSDTMRIIEDFKSKT
jgi:hypothetical protein